MGMTMTEKILARASGKSVVKPGEKVSAKVDKALIHEVTGVPAADEFYKKYGKDAKVWDRTKFVVTPDHYVPNKDIPTAILCQKLAKFVADQNIPTEDYYPVGENYGVCHVMLPQEGYALPGTVVVGADSHTCTHGAFGLFSYGIGQSMMGEVFATGKIEIVVPPTMRFIINGKLPKNVMAKDIILRIIGDIGDDGARGQAMEFAGTAVENMSIDERMTLTNMAIEAGATNGIIAPDAKTLEYLKGRAKGKFEPVYNDTDAEFSAVYEYDASKIVPTVSKPYKISNTSPACDLQDMKINQAVIVACTGGKFYDLQAAAMVLKENISVGKKVAKGVRLLVIPTTQKVYKKALETGLLKIFSDAGAIISAPTCGPCLGGHMGILGPGEVAISSSNRNFEGRMGDKTSQLYLASPMTVAQSAVEGRICPYDARNSKPTAGQPYVIKYRKDVKIDDTPPLSKEVLGRQLRGKAYVIPKEGVNTDVIIPARYLTTADPSILKKHALEDLDDKEFPIRFVKEDGTTDFKVIVAAKDFGSGSSREHAPVALYGEGTGAVAVVAPSFARIFLYNSIKTKTIIPLESKEDISKEIKTGDDVEIDKKEWKLINHTSGKTYDLKKPKIE
jgi:3-isopropylmalate/(R)-2-methylmalate dehydratase large subunit